MGHLLTYPSRTKFNIGCMLQCASLLITHVIYCHVIFVLKVVEDGYEFFAKRQLVTLFSAPNYCGEFDNAGAMMSVDETLMCSFQVGRQTSWLFSLLSL